MLSRKTIENLTDKLMVEVANYVTEDPRFTELLNELVPEAIDLELGQVDDYYAVVQIITSIPNNTYVVVLIIHKYIILVALYNHGNYLFCNTSHTLYNISISYIL